MCVIPHVPALPVPHLPARPCTCPAVSCIHFYLHAVPSTWSTFDPLLIVNIIQLILRCFQEPLFWKRSHRINATLLYAQKCAFCAPSETLPNYFIFLCLGSLYISSMRGSQRRNLVSVFILLRDHKNMKHRAVAEK